MSHQPQVEVPEDETPEERKARLAKAKASQRVLGVANRQMTRAQLLEIVAGDTPIRSPEQADTAGTLLGPTPQASIEDTNNFLRRAAAASGGSVDALLPAFAQLDAIEASRASEKIAGKRRRRSALKHGLAGAATVLTGATKNLFGGKPRQGTVASKGSRGPRGSGRPNSQSNRAINPRFATLRTKPDDRIS